MTVEVDQVGVESRLVSGQVVCPGCLGALRPWGWARPRGVHGLVGVLHPRRARCPVCLVTHVLLPVTVLLRRVYAVEVIGVALVARAGGSGHRVIGAGAGGSGGDGAGLAAGDGRPVGGGADVVAGGGPPRRGGPGGAQGAGVAVARRARRVGGGDRGGDWPLRCVRVLGPVTVWQVAAACSAGRLLSPGWPPRGAASTGNTSRL